MYMGKKLSMIEKKSSEDSGELDMGNFTVKNSVHGKFIINKHNVVYKSRNVILGNTADYMEKYKKTHIEHEIQQIITIIKVLKSRKKEKLVVLDIGANVGYVSVPIANELGDGSGEVYAFEPQRMLYFALCGTIAMNDLANLFPHHIAIGHHNGFIKVRNQDYGRTNDFGLLNLNDQSDITDDNSTEVEIKNVDSLHIGGLDFLKIDVEGMEIDVLRGGRKSIESFRPWFWIEYDKIDRSDLIFFFKDLEYKIIKMNSLNLVAAPKEKLKASKIIFENTEPF